MSETEQVALCSDRASGLRAVIAIDDTTLGPGLGGVRWLPYPSEQAAVDEARRLARVMTLKNACADLPYGGGKSVILDDGMSRAGPGAATPSSGPSDGSWTASAAPTSPVSTWARRWRTWP